MRHEQPEFVKMFFREVNEEIKIRKIPKFKLAEKAGVTKCSISLILSGKVTPSMGMILKITNALGMKPVLCLMEKEEIK